MDMNKYRNAYKNKLVLVTGADGFIGSHLTERLINYEAQVIILIRANSRNGTKDYELKNIQHLKHKLKKIIASDLGSPDTKRLIERERPEIIFHLGAEAFVDRSFDQPAEVIRTNINGTLNVLESGLDNNRKPHNWLKRIVCTSSSEVYGSNNLPMNEKSLLNPTSPYAASKVAVDRISFSYYNTYGLPVSIIRPFNAFGPRHTYDAPPKFIEFALSNKDITIYGKGDQTRDWNYVDNTVDAFLIMGIEKKAIGEAVNFGSGKDTKVIELANKIIKLSQSKSKIVNLPPRMSEVKRMCCNSSKAKKLFNWQPTISFEEGLKKNIKWKQNKLKGN